MYLRRNDGLILGASVVGFLIMSASFMLMTVKSLNHLPGMMFWGGLVMGIGTQIVLEIRRRAFFASYHVKRQRMQKPRNGLLTFGSNKFAKAADMAMVIGFLGTILAILLTRGVGNICYVLISFTVFSLCMHCVLNGRIYVYVMNHKKIQQVLEQKKANSHSKGEEER